MPFQVSFSSYLQLSGNSINSFNPGSDETITCQPGNTLIATIVGTLTGHTFTWVQIPAPGAMSFVPVTWITGTPAFGGTTGVVSGQMVYATYTQSEGSDKYFRFYIDYGKYIQQYADVANYNTPIAREYITSVPAATPYTHSAYGLNFSRTLNQGTTITLTPFQAGADGSASSPPTSFELQATFSVDATQIKYVLIQQNTGSAWTTIDTLPSSVIHNNTLLYGPVSNSYSYRIVAVYVGTATQFTYSATQEPSQAVWATISNPTIAAKSEFTVPVGQRSLSVLPVYNVLIPTIKRFGPDPPQDTYDTPLNSITHPVVSTYNVLIPTLKVFGPNPPQDTYDTPVNSITYPVMTTYAYSIPGGISIGG